LEVVLVQAEAQALALWWLLAQHYSVLLLNPVSAGLL
jgi:hypothetical protein